MGYIRILCTLSFYFSSSASPVSSDCVAFTLLSLPTEWRLTSSPFSLLLALSPPGAILDALATELQLQSRLSQTECIRLHCSLSFAFCLSLHSLFCLLFLFLVHSRFRFERNCGFVQTFSDRMHSARLLPLIRFLFIRLNCGFEAGFLRLNAFSFTTVFPFLPVYLSFLSSACSLSMSAALATESRLRSRISPTECIRLIAFCLSLHAIYFASDGIEAS
jgi:hypothetical protein